LYCTQGRLISIFILFLFLSYAIFFHSFGTAQKNTTEHSEFMNTIKNKYTVNKSPPQLKDLNPTHVSFKVILVSCFVYLLNYLIGVLYSNPALAVDTPHTRLFCDSLLPVNFHFNKQSTNFFRHFYRVFLQFLKILVEMLYDFYLFIKY